MINKIDLKAVLVFLACTLGVMGMFMGAIQNVIGFADPLNEIIFTVMLAIGSIGALMNIKR